MTALKACIMFYLCSQCIAVELRSEPLQDSVYLVDKYSNATKEYKFYPTGDFEVVVYSLDNIPDIPSSSAVVDLFDNDTYKLLASTCNLRISNSYENHTWEVRLSNSSVTARFALRFCSDVCDTNTCPYNLYCHGATLVKCTAPPNLNPMFIPLIICSVLAFVVAIFGLVLIAVRKRRQYEQVT